MTTMRKTFTFPKVAYTSTRRVNLPTIEVELRDADTYKPELSICGDLWNATHTDIIMGGQCLDEFAKFDELFCNPLFKKLHRLWRAYHLNSLKSGGPLQEAALKDCQLSSYEERCSYLESRGLLYEDGVKYGAQWWYHKIPDNDLKEIVSLLAEQQVYYEDESQNAKRQQ